MSTSARFSSKATAPAELLRRSAHPSPEVGSTATAAGGPSATSEPTPAARRARMLLLASAALTLLCALAFPLAPVSQPVVTFAWPQPGGGTASALPLMPYQPVSFDASVRCDAVRATPPGAPVLATTPPGSPDGPFGGLRVLVDGPTLTVSSNGVTLATTAVPAGACTLAVASTPERTEVRLDGLVIGAADRDVRPVVASLLTGAPTTDGLAVTLQTDTRFQTTPGVVKWLLGAGCLLGLAGMLAGAVLHDGRSRRVRLPVGRPRIVDARRPRVVDARRPRVVDAVVGAGLVVWAVIGPATIDDGYIAGILRGRSENGVIGNVFRWLNAPEAPFSWFYEVDRWWAALAPGAASVLWMRVPATVLGMLCWLLLRRHALPRLGPLLRGRASVPWIAAVVFAAWWAPFGLSLRPEPWLATGVLAVWVATERAVATRRLLPLVVAATVAGLTVALTPGALAGVVPLLVALPALARGATTSGHRSGGRLRVAVVAGGLAVAVLPMAADQSLAGILEATRVRRLIGGGQPWWAELTRYVDLLTPGQIQGSLGPRLPVLLLLVALPAVAWSVLGSRRSGVAPGPAGRLLVTTALSLLLLTLSPTKWTLHFGEFAGLGTAVVTLLVLCWSPRQLRKAQTTTRRGTGPRDTGLASVAVLGAVLLTAALVLLGSNTWPYASGWGVVWNDVAPQLFGIQLATVALPVAIGVTLVLGVVVAVLTARRPLSARWVRLIAPGPLVLVLVTVVVALEGSSFVKATLDRAGTYSYGTDGLATLAGDPCGMPRKLRVELDPAAGVLPNGPPAAEPAGRPDDPDDVPDDGPAFVPTAVTPAPVPLRAGDVELPGWHAAPGARATLRSGWYVLSDDARRGEVPVAVTVSGSIAGAARIALEFAASPSAAPVAVSPAGAVEGTGSRDLRAVAPADATLVQVRAEAFDQGTTATALGGNVVPPAVSVPRVPRTVPFDAAVPPGATVLSDWPIAFPFPCFREPALTGGTAEIPPWRLTPPGGSDAGGIATATSTGGPYAGPRLLVDEQRRPVYLVGDPARDPVDLVRWVPTRAWSALRPQVGSESRPGWAHTGRANVPGLDTP